jgi:hypothetical protein
VSRSRFTSQSHRRAKNRQHPAAKGLEFGRGERTTWCSGERRLRPNDRHQATLTFLRTDRAHKAQNDIVAAAQSARRVAHLLWFEEEPVGRLGHAPEMAKGGDVGAWGALTRTYR